MIGFKVRNNTIGSIGRVRSNFFDRPAVMAAMDRATHFVFAKFGAFVRQRAISIQLRKHVRSFGVRSKVKNMAGTSNPGEPPYVHTGLIVKHIEFEYSWIRKSVIIGPLLLRGKKTPDALNALEYGGNSVVWNRRANGRYVMRRTQVRARPFMHPAFENELPKLPGMWAEAFRRIAHQPLRNAG